MSEVMLQQTQALRVVEKYRAFTKRFPIARSLAAAKLSSVLGEWQGLGYNRRAKMLHEAARAIVREHNGAVPGDPDALLALPGVGPYTAAAILVFAYNQPRVMIETNIRSVYLHHFFPDQKNIPDSELTHLIGQTLDTRHPRKWYWALMDYGAHLKKTLPNPGRRSLHHSKQSPFRGSDRQIRGGIIRELIKKQKQTTAELARALDTDPGRVRGIIVRMRHEGLLKKQNQRFVIA
ncbi:MAG: A/G-specific adenine glycosylase [Patescibacteria group bacterium]